MNRNRTIFRWVIILFTLLMIGLAIDMARNTTAPWNKAKEVRGKRQKVRGKR